MKYGLALRLKEAGFPQEYGWGSWICEHGAEYDPDREKFCDCYGEKLIRNVTLSELIDACVGEYWFSLVELKPHAWRAEGKTLDMKRLDGEGKTPEIAVANLWLAINSK